MTEPFLLHNLGVIVVGALAFVLVLRVARVPNIVAYILAGLTLGPITGIIGVTEAVDLISEFGIALLLFLVGLELSIEKIRDVGPVAVGAGIGQVVFTAAGGFALSWGLGFGMLEAVFIAVALTFSSTVVVVKLLDEKGDIDSLYGRIAVGIFLVQDLVVVIALTFLSGLANPDDLSLEALATGLGEAFGGMFILLILAIIAARYILPPLFEYFSRSAEALFICSIAWCFLFVVTAEYLQLSVEIGAFLAGISIAQLPYNHDLRRRVHPLVNFFIAIFFVSLGLQMELAAAQEHAVPALILSLFVLIGNPFIFMLIIVRFGYSNRNSFLTSVTVAQISEFSFIFAAMGLSAGLIDESILSLIALVGLITIATSAYMILYNRQLYKLLEPLGIIKLFGGAEEDRDKDTDVLSDHIIVIGQNSLGREITRKLAERDQQVLAIDTDINKLNNLPAHKLQGSAAYASVLEEARLKHAKLLVSTLSIEQVNNLLAFRAKEAGVPISVHIFDESVRDDLEALNVDYMINPKEAGARLLVHELHEGDVLRS